MPNIGRLCVGRDDGRYYNSITHRLIEESELSSDLMLAGQERDAIIAELTKDRPAFVTIEPSMECNLRCKHCYVGHLLEKPSGNKDGDVDPDKALKFLKSLRMKCGLKSIAFVGGEPFLHPDLIRKIQGGMPDALYNATTNGVWDFDEVADVIAKFKFLTFSIDGLPDDHNEARKSLDKSIGDPFGHTYRNLQRTIKEFPHIEVEVQGAIKRLVTADDHENYHILMRFAGVKSNRIKLSTAAPTVRWREEKWALPLRTYRSKPCCDFAVGHAYVVRGDLVYSSYYNQHRIEPLGSLDDDVETLRDNYLHQALESMPMLKDETCMTKCGGVGACWGFCSNLQHYVGSAPSAVCDRESAERLVANAAAAAN